MARNIALIAGLALLIGTGGGGVYATGTFGPAPAEASSKKEPKAEGDASRSLPDTTYVQLDPLAAPVIGGGKVRYNVMLTLSVELADQAQKPEIARLMPRLRDAMLMELYARPVTRDDESGRIDLVAVKERMFVVAQEIVGRKVVRDLLVVSAIRTG